MHGCMTINHVFHLSQISFCLNLRCTLGLNVVFAHSADLKSDSLDLDSPYEIFVRELVAKDGNDQNEILLLDASGEPEKETYSYRDCITRLELPEGCVSQHALIWTCSAHICQYTHLKIQYIRVGFCQMCKGSLLA
jgi:hypothetical protein